MANFSDMTVEVKAKLCVDRKTAETCLRLVEIFCNENGVDVIGHRDEDGRTTLEFMSKHSSTGISKDALGAIMLLGHETHKEE